MAAQEQETNRSGSHPSSHKQNTTNTQRRKVLGVNFDEMNFEQRRAPYNSGQNNIEERQYDKDRNDDQPDPKRTRH